MIRVVVGGFVGFVLLVGALVLAPTASVSTGAASSAAVLAVAERQSRERCTDGAPADVPVVEGQGAVLAAKAAAAAGWTGPDLLTAVMVAGAESSYDPTAGNQLADGRTHQGLWQISSLHTALIAEHGGDRYDPVANAQMAHVLWSDSKAAGRDPWQPWEAYTNGNYQRYRAAAEDAIRAIGTEVAAQPAVARAVAACTPAAGVAPGALVPGDIAPSGWTLPSDGAYTSAYGMRLHPTKGIWKLHGGIDLSGGCGTPVRSAASGVVTQAGPTASYGTLITIAHANGVTTLYAHSRLADHRVRIGQPVVAGQQITSEGTEGDSTGCHLHLEVRVNNERTDPAAFLAARGVTLPPLT